MEAVDLKVKYREKPGRGISRTLRKNGEVPGIVYGKGANNLLIEFSEMELDSILNNYGEHAVVNLEVNGSKVKAMVKEVQREPVNRRLVHVDMKYINDGEVVHADIPVMIKGENYLKSRGGVIQKQLATVSVEAAPDKIPKYLVADVSNLKPGDRLTIADMEISSEIAVMSDIHSVIASVVNGSEMEKLQDVGE